MRESEPQRPIKLSLYYGKSSRHPQAKVPGQCRFTFNARPTSSGPAASAGSARHPLPLDLVHPDCGGVGMGCSGA